MSLSLVHNRVNVHRPRRGLTPTGAGQPLPGDGRRVLGAHGDAPPPASAHARAPAPALRAAARAAAAPSAPALPAARATRKSLHNY